MTITQNGKYSQVPHRVLILITFGYSFECQKWVPPVKCTHIVLTTYSEPIQSTPNEYSQRTFWVLLRVWVCQMRTSLRMVLRNISVYTQRILTLSGIWGSFEKHLNILWVSDTHNLLTVHEYPKVLKNYYKWEPSEDLLSTLFFVCWAALI